MTRSSGGFPATEWVLTAIVDVRLGEVVERSRGTATDLADEDEVLLAAIEMLRCGERPVQVMLLGAEHVHLYRRSATEPNRAAIAIARRTSNLGLDLSRLRARLGEVTS